MVWYYRSVGRLGCGWGTSRQAGSFRDVELGFRLAQSVGAATREVDLLKGSECSLCRRNPVTSWFDLE